MKQSTIDAIKLFTETFPKENQVLICVEELAELSKVLLKNVNRNKDNRDDIVEELGDCYLFLKQLEMIYNITQDELDSAMDAKLPKGLRRVKEYKEKHGE